MHKPTTRQPPYLVLLLQFNNLWQGTHLAFHAVDALHNDEDLLPGPPRPWLPIRNVLSQQGLKMQHIIVCKNLQHTGESVASIASAACDLKTYLGSAHCLG